MKLAFQEQQAVVTVTISIALKTGHERREASKAHSMMANCFEPETIKEMSNWRLFS
jgi:hypothetical protein